MSNIETETHFLFHILFNFVKLPFFLVLVLLGQRQFADRPRPIREFLHFLMQAQGTFWLCIALIAVFILQITLFVAGFDIDQYLFHPSDLITLNLLPFITSMLMHGDIFHLFGNLLVLLPTGRALERAWGTGRFLLIFFGAGLISKILSALAHLFILDQNTPSLGASGAIMGVAAVASLIAPFMLTYEFLIPLPMIALFWGSILADITGAINPTSNINHYAHLGGAISILFLAYFLSPEEKHTLKKGLIINLITIVAAFALIILFS